jgi:uncharacterized repeat protein (TIGR01451 family)
VKHFRFMSVVSVVVVILGLLMAVPSAAPKAKAGSATGWILLNEVAPQPGQTITFSVVVNNLPQNGGATHDGFVQLQCTLPDGTVYTAWEGAFQGSWDPPFVLPTVEAGQSYSCRGTLIVDTWNKFPTQLRVTGTNFLDDTPLFFVGE